MTGKTMEQKNSVASKDKARQPSAWLPLTLIILALAAIASTALPPALQQGSTLLGMPLILWFWFAVSLLSAALTTLAAWKIISDKSTEKTGVGSDD